MPIHRLIHGMPYSIYRTRVNQFVRDNPKIINWVYSDLSSLHILLSDWQEGLLKNGREQELYRKLEELKPQIQIPDIFLDAFGLKMLLNAIERKYEENRILDEIDIIGPEIFGEYLINGDEAFESREIPLDLMEGLIREIEKRAYPVFKEMILNG